MELAKWFCLYRSPQENPNKERHLVIGDRRDLYALGKRGEKCERGSHSGYPIFLSPPLVVNYIKYKLLINLYYFVCISQISNGQSP